MCASHRQVSARKRGDSPSRDWPRKMAVSEGLARESKNENPNHTVFEGTGYLFEAGNKLRLPDEAICSACVMFHTFFETETTREYCLHLLALAALHLAGKTYECEVRVGDVCNVGYRCAHPPPEGKPLTICPAYWKLKESITQYELYLLRVLRFDIKVDLPHQYLVHFLLALSRWVDAPSFNKTRVGQVSWSLLNDCFRTSLCRRHKPDCLATAVLYLAVRLVGLTVPCQGARRRWWEVFCPGCSEKQMQIISAEMMDAYSKEPILLGQPPQEKQDQPPQTSQHTSSSANA